ncbi:TRAP transporter large permease [Chloroflexota bacterium]
MEFIGIAAMLLLLVSGAPIFLACFMGVALIVNLALGIDGTVIWAVMFDKLNSSVLLAVPLFMFSGMLLQHGGAADSLVKLLTSFLGHIRGGAAYAVVIACIIFAAMSAVSIAAVAAMAPVFIPCLVACGYSKKFSIGLILCAGSIASLIPPSIELIIYGFITQTSVISLWTAGIIPGLIMALFFAITIWFHSKRGHYVPLPRATWGERWKALKHGWPVAIMPLVVLGPLYANIASPTEISAIAAVYSLLLVTLVYRKMKLKQFWRASYETVSITTAIFAIFIGALLLNTALVYVRIPYRLTDLLVQSGMNWASFMLVIYIVYLLMGSLLDSSSILMISVPILFSTVMSLGINPITFGVFTTLSCEIAYLTPPYGMLLFAGAAVLREDFVTVAKSTLLFYPALVVTPILVAYIPQLSLWLPNLLGHN